MSELVKQWFDLLGSMFGVFLSHVEFGAVVVGTLAAIGVTQLVKTVVIHSPGIPNGPWRVWYLTTTVVGLSITFLLWPTRLGFAWGIGAGTLFAPMLYLIGTRTLYRYMPELESRISATPKE